VIIAIGGGSTLDMGKLINYYHNCNTDNIPKSNFINERFDPVPIICIPTTAGSGSESTNFAVMYVNGIKYSIQHKNLLPHFVFIDPELHFSQTSYQKAVSGIDAFSQAVESLWSIKSTDESRTYAERSLKLIWENYYKVVHSHDNLAHLNMAVGANLAGKAINISNTTAPHALSYKITSLYGVPHGHAVALTLPLFFDYNFSCIPKICDLNLKKTLIEAKDTIFRILKCKSINEGKSKIERLILDAGLEMKLSKLGSRDKKDIKKIVEDVNQQRLSNNPYPVSGNSLINMLENIW
jgi:alcohol dehydrogenase class IV